MLASFQLTGMIPSESDRFNSLHSEGTISSATLIRSRLGMPSARSLGGIQVEYSFSYFGYCQLNTWEVVRVSMDWFDVDSKGMWSFGEVNTELKNRLSTFAFSTLSLTKAWPSLRKEGFWFIFVADFMNDQKHFGFSSTESRRLLATSFFFLRIICLVYVSVV